MALTPGDVISGIGSLLGFSSNVANSKRAIRAQAAENEKIRQYNSALASRQNQWNIDQWNRENVYNTPAAQMARMKAAGLNPDLAYGQQNLSAASPQMTAGESSPVQDFSGIANRQTIGDAMMQFNQSRLVEAQAKLAESQANKTDVETEGQKSTNKILESDAAFRDAINSGTVKLNNVTITNTESSTSLNRKQAAVLDEQIGQIRANVDKIRQEISNLSSEQAISRLRYIMDRELNEFQIKKISAETGLTYAQTKSISEQLPYVIANLKANTFVSNSQGLVNMANVDLLNSSLLSANAELPAKQLEGLWNEKRLEFASKSPFLMVVDRFVNVLGAKVLDIPKSISRASQGL